MKKILLLILLICLFACSTKIPEEEIEEEKTYYTQDEINITYDRDSNFNNNEEEDEKEELDIDLTFMSSTAKFAEVYNMLINPEDYDGKTIKISGLFSLWQDYNGNQIFGCIVPDATACCANGIQFIWAGEHSYPEDYPEQGDMITVQGTFGYDKTDDYIMIYLDNAELTFNKSLS